MKEGYWKIADLMSRYPEHAIFRSFRSLNMRNLLYLQAELSNLEEELDALEQRDAAHPDRQSYARHWWFLRNGSDDENTEQWEKFEEIRQKLEQYNDTLYKQAYLASLHQPRKYDLDFLRRWLRRPKMGNFPLLGCDRSAWDLEKGHGLVAIKARPEADLFTNWFTEKGLPAVQHWLESRFPNLLLAESSPGFHHYDDSTLNLVIGTITTVVASILPILSIVALYFIRSSGIQLAMIVVFSSLFSLALSVLTQNSRKVEVFAATSAFAAVNVVFLTNGSCNLRTG